jgi:hypothetical protein
MRNLLAITAVAGAIACAGNAIARENAPGDVLRLLFVAQQQALAATCEGFEIDRERFRTVMNSILGSLQALTEPEQNNLPVDVVMHALGVAVGGQIAVAAFDQDAYCARGEVVKAEMAEDSEGRIAILVME